MQVIPPALDRLIDDLGKLPGIGRKTATRLALNILRRPAGYARELAEALAELHAAIQLCSCCFAFSESDPCGICADVRRDGELVCVVEEPGDLMAIEKTASFRASLNLNGLIVVPLDMETAKASIASPSAKSKLVKKDIEQLLHFRFM